MDILFCAIKDWANAGSLMAKAVRSVGGDAQCVVRHHHVFNYGNNNNNTQWINIVELQKMVDESKAIVLLHSDEYQKLEFSGQKVAVFHGGSKYRRHYQKLNRLFNRFVDITLIQTADLLEKGPKDAYWVMPPIDTEYLLPDFKTEDKLIFAHHPSNSRFKGSDAIKYIMSRFPDVRFNFDLSILEWNSHLDRLRKCDVYIERMNLNREGNVTGVWGMSAMEAAALGKIVVTNDLWRSSYIKHFGNCPLIVANSVEELEEVVTNIISMSKSDIISLKKATRYWVVKNHSMEPTGKRLMGILT